MNFTVLGASGFIGSNLVRYLTSQGYSVKAISNDYNFKKGEYLGNIIYAIGMTGNFSRFPSKTFEAHVSKLIEVLNFASFDSLIYLSSTRIYGSATGTAKENDEISVIPGSDHVYNLTKLLGESFCLTHENPRVKIVRLSNVYGRGMKSTTFLGSLLQNSFEQKKIEVEESPQSSKDYISIDDVVRLLEKISLSSRYQIYNLANGHNTTHFNLVSKISNLTGFPVYFKKQSKIRIFKNLDISRIKTEFSYSPCDILSDIPLLLEYENRIVS